MDLAHVVTSGAFILGGLAVLGGVGHWIGVTGMAVHERRLFQVRHATMLAIGFLPFLAGLFMVLGAWRAVTGATMGMTIIAATTTLFALLLLILWPVLSRPPEGNVPGAIATIVVFSSEAVLAWIAR